MPKAQRVRAALAPMPNAEPPLGKLVPFTRHPLALARLASLRIRDPATGRLVSLTAGAQRVLHVLVTWADREGVTWVSLAEIQRLIGVSEAHEHYTLRWLDKCVERLRDLGLLRWRRVMPMARFPSRDKHGRVVWGNGTRTCSGGRVWQVNFRAIVAKPLKSPDTNCTSDPDTNCTSDPLISSLSEKNLTDPAHAPRGRASAPPPAAEMERTTTVREREREQGREREQTASRAEQLEAVRLALETVQAALRRPAKRRMESQPDAQTR